LNIWGSEKKIDYLWALLGFVGIGTYMVPVRFSTSKGFSFFHLMGWGLALVVVLRWSSVRSLWGHPLWFWAALLSGLLWGLGQISANLALEEMSLAKAVVYFNFNTLLNIGLGLAVFHEATGIRSYGFLLVGAGALTAGAIWVAQISAPFSKERNLKKGILLSLLTGFFWGIYFFPMTWARSTDPQGSIGQLDVLIVMAMGGAVTAFSVPLFTKIKGFSWRDLGLASGSSLLWILGMAGMLIAIEQLGLSRAVPIVNANSLIYAGLSLLVFKELRFDEWPKVLGSGLLALAGVVLMALSN
jgi:glucose uptake protein GlcU